MSKYPKSSVLGAKNHSGRKPRCLGAREVRKSYNRINIINNNNNSNSDNKYNNDSKHSNRSNNMSRVWFE